jgi:hypothetical protein
MTSQRSRMLAHCGLAFVALVCSTSHAQTRNDDVLFAIRKGRATVASRFSKLADFQRQLAHAAQKCGVSVENEHLFADGWLGKDTLEALRRLTKCPGYTRLSRDSLSRGEITTEVWQIVAPKIPPPDPTARAHMMTFAHERTDYTAVEFNVGTPDNGILTWGPQGATAGQAFQVQRILRKVDAQLPGLIDEAFAKEAIAVRALAGFRTTAAAGRAIALVLSVKLDSVRRSAWKDGFRRLGERAEVRLIYDDQMGANGASGAPAGVADFFRSYWAHCWRPTEVDFAFFLDRAIQMDVRQQRTDMATTAVAAVEQRAGDVLSPAERRRVIAANFIAGNPRFIADRLYRDVAYYVDVSVRRVAS